MQVVKDYLDNYMDKYPNEVDPSYEEVIAFIGDIYIDDNILALYYEYEDRVLLVHYWSDFGGLSIGELKSKVNQHHRFIDSFDKDVYISDIKDFFNKRSICEYDESKKLWRFR